MFLLRKFDKRSCWATSDKSLYTKQDACADVVTCGDLKTKNNGLSIWKVDNKNEDDIKKALLACIIQKDRIEDTNYIIFEDVELKSSGLEFMLSDYETGIAGMDNKHYNMIKLTGSGLTKFAAIMQQKIDIADESCVDTYTQDRVKSLYRHALDNNWIEQKELKKKIAKLLEK